MMNLFLTALSRSLPEDVHAVLDADEPRAVDLLGHGPRWAGSPYAATPELDGRPAIR